MKPKYAQHIQHLRDTRYGTTQQSLAEFMGVSRAYVSGIERGVNFPNQNYVDSLRDHMGLSPQENIIIGREIKHFQDATRNIKTGNLSWQQKAMVKKMVMLFECDALDEVAVNSFIENTIDELEIKEKPYYIES